MEDKSFPKFQYSEFTQNGKGQFVVRADDIKEFDQACAHIRLRLHPVNPTPQVVLAPKTADDGLDWSIQGKDGKGGLCPVHGTQLVFKSGTSKAGKLYAFWACEVKNADGTFCKQGK